MSQSGRAIVRLRATIVRVACPLVAFTAASALAVPGESCVPTIEEPGFCGDGGRATDARLAAPYGVARLQRGFLVADSGNNRIRRILPGGRITTVAGTGTAGFSGDGGPAVKAELSLPTGVAGDRGGGFLIADTANNRVRRVAPNGRITTVAGVGTEGFSGDGGAATNAKLFSPANVAATADGGFLIADNGNRRVRRVSPDGVIETVAGTGRQGFSGDGGPATEAELGAPTGLAALPSGGFLVADSQNNTIRRVAGDGTITTVAGTGDSGATGDLGAATEAELAEPSDVTLRGDSGAFVIADTGNQAIRRVSVSGQIATIAGTGTAGFSGDGGPAVEADLTAPTGVSAAGHTVLIADNGNARIRSVSSGGTIATIAGSGPVSEDPDVLARSVDYPKRGTIAYFNPNGRSAQAGRPFRISYVVTNEAKARIRVLRKGRVVRREQQSADSGLNAERVRPLRHGRYIARLFVGKGGQDDQQDLRIKR